MKMMSNKKADELRRLRNASLLRRMEDGDELTSFNSNASWFPPRPIIKKNNEAIERLYGVGTDKRLQRAFDHVVETGKLPESDETQQSPIKSA
jgi:hypothetical protein